MAMAMAMTDGKILSFVYHCLSFGNYVFHLTADLQQVTSNSVRVGCFQQPLGSIPVDLPSLGGASVAQRGEGYGVG